MLVAYASKDPSELPLEARDGKAAYAHWKSERPMRADIQFLGRMDTLQISHSFGIKEATIHRWITMERCRRLNLPSPYGVRP